MDSCVWGGAEPRVEGRKTSPRRRPGFAEGLRSTWRAILMVRFVSRFEESDVHAFQ